MTVWLLPNVPSGQSNARTMGGRVTSSTGLLMHTCIRNVQIQVHIKCKNCCWSQSGISHIVGSQETNKQETHYGSSLQNNQANLQHGTSHKLICHKSVHHLPPSHLQGEIPEIYWFHRKYLLLLIVTVRLHTPLSVSVSPVSVAIEAAKIKKK